MTNLVYYGVRVFFIIGAISSTIHASIAADAPTTKKEYLLKESFESGKKSPTGWREGADVPGVEYIWADAEASHGKRSLGLRKTENRYFPIAQWIRTIQHAGGAANLEVCLKAKAAQAQKAIVDVQFYADGSDLIGHQWLAYLGAKEEGDGPADHDWARYGGVVPVPAGTKKIGVALQIYGPGEVWFDELTARYVPKAGQAAASDVNSKTTPAAPLQTDATPASAAEGAITLNVKDDETGEYYFLPAGDKPAGLLVVLPGGDGSAEFHPFVKSIHAHGLGGKFAVAHLISKRWRTNQEITWPTHRTRTPGMKFTTEEFITAAVADAAKRQAIDAQHVYLLGWSSGGPPCYASMLQKDSPASGAFVAMSIFRKNDYAAAANAAGKSFYIYHSPEDEVCPPRMAREANDTLSAAGAKTTLVDYAGGHGWHGDMLGSIREGVEWLEASREAK